MAAWVPVAVVGVVAVAARLYGLSAKSLWFDELYSLYVAQQAPADLFRTLRDQDVHPPLHYLLLRGWMVIAGDSEATVRVPSAAAGVATVVLVYLLGRRAGGRAVGLVAALLQAVAPFAVWAEQQARMYPFLTLWVVAASLLLVQALEGGRPGAWAAYAGVLALAFYTHYLAFLLIPAHAAVVAHQRQWPPVRAWGAAVVLAGILFAPWLPAVVGHVVSGKGWPAHRPPLSVHAVTDLWGLLVFGGGAFNMGTPFRTGTLPLVYQGPLLFPVGVLAVAGALSLRGPARATVLAVCGMPVLALALSLRWHIYYARYFVFVSPAVAVLVAGGVVGLARALVPSTRLAVATALVALVPLSYSAVGLLAYYQAPSIQNWRAAGQHLAARIGPRDVVLFVPAIATVARYYVRAVPAWLALEPGEILHPQVVADGGALSRQRLTVLAQRHPRLWIVATAPVGIRARVRLQEILAPYYRERAGWDFSGVYVFEWASRAHPGLPER